MECGLNRKMMTVSIIGETDKNGEFKVEIPSSIFQSVDELNKCWLRPCNSPYESSKIPSTSSPSKLMLPSDSNGVITYSAGSFSYRHETVLASCYMEDFLTMVRGREMTENVDQSSKAVQQTPTTPLLPNFPPATLPNVPPLPNFGISPLPKTPPLPTIPPLPSAPPLPKIAPLPNVRPLPKIPTLALLTVPPFPKPTILGSPPFPQIPQIPQIPNFQFPPILFLMPPPLGH